VDVLSLIAAGLQVVRDPVDLAVALATRHGLRMVLAALVGLCTQHGRRPVALQAPVGALVLVLRGPVSVPGLVLARLAQADRVVRVV
jgi:hypothetical protein